MRGILYNTIHRLHPVRWVIAWVLSAPGTARFNMAGVSHSAFGKYVLAGYRFVAGYIDIPLMTNDVD